MKTTKYGDRKSLEFLKTSLANESITAEEVFRSPDGTNHIHGLVNVLTGRHRQDAALQLLAAHVIANLTPLGEKYGQVLARSAGPYLVTLLSGSGSLALREASAIALGNISLAGFKVVKILLNQEAVESLADSLDSRNDEKILSAALYALYHIFHSLQAVGKEETIQKELYVKVTEKCISLLSTRAPLELYWVLFVLSCDVGHHDIQVHDDVINFALDTCTYEIFQKSDPRPLVKVVTPIVRLLANLCAGPRSEAACLHVLRHPDLSAILMALLATNYIHLCKETLWLFANIVNCESVIVQEQLIELDLMDKLEYHTVQAVQKLDPYALLKM